MKRIPYAAPAGAVLWCALVLAGCAAGGGKNFDLSQALDVGKSLTTAVTPIDEKEEIEIGRGVAGHTLGAAPLVADRGLQAYVNRVGKWVALQSERPGLPWHFGVIEDSTVNAFAAPGGYILITRGLYELLDNEAQLAGVLGHEITHVVERHHITVMQKQAVVAAGARTVQRDNRAALVNSVTGTFAEVFARGLDKSAEYEADQHGVILAARAGYNPYALVDVLHKLQARGSNDPATAFLFSTHPLPADRLSRLGDALTPRVASLPAGRQPRIRPLAARGR